MVIFTISTKELFSRIESGKSISPIDIVVDAELPFIKQKFGKYLINVEKVRDGSSLLLFHCSVPDTIPISQFRTEVFGGEWGHFMPKRMLLSTTSPNGGPVKATVSVCLSGDPSVKDDDK